MAKNFEMTREKASDRLQTDIELIQELEGAVFYGEEFGRSRLKRRVVMKKSFNVSTSKEDLTAFNFGSLKGYVRTDFQRLCEIFGPPTFGPFDYTRDKVTCEWKIKTDEGLLVTIYDWKMEATPLGLYDWHIGGHAFDNVEWVGKQLRQEAWSIKRFGLNERGQWVEQSSGIAPISIGKK